MPTSWEHGEYDPKTLNKIFKIIGNIHYHMPHLCPCLQRSEDFPGAQGRGVYEPSDMEPLEDQCVLLGAEHCPSASFHFSVCGCGCVHMYKLVFVCAQN